MAQCASPRENGKAAVRRRPASCLKVQPGLRTGQNESELYLSGGFADSADSITDLVLL
jgi:hypothetical protein